MSYSNSNRHVGLTCAGPREADSWKWMENPGHMASGASREDAPSPTATTHSVDSDSARRSDGSQRPDKRRVRDGYIPQEEQPRYKAPRPARQHGMVVEWSAKRGYGFIRPDSLGANLFTHLRDLMDASELQPGDVVEFERHPPDEGERNDRAKNVRRVSELQRQAAMARNERAATSTAPRSVTHAPKRSAALLIPRSVAKATRTPPPAPSTAAAGSTAAARQRPRQPPEAGVLGYM